MAFKLRHGTKERTETMDNGKVRWVGGGGNNAVKKVLGQQQRHQRGRRRCAMHAMQTNCNCNIGFRLFNFEYFHRILFMRFCSFDLILKEEKSERRVYKVSQRDVYVYRLKEA